TAQAPRRAGAPRRSELGWGCASSGGSYPIVLSCAGMPWLPACDSLAGRRKGTSRPPGALPLGRQSRGPALSEDLDADLIGDEEELAVGAITGGSCHNAPNSDTGPGPPARAAYY